MRPTTFLRIAAVLTLIHSTLHTIGGVFGKVPPGPAEHAVTAMKANQFELMGGLRTYWNFYMGFGLGITIFLTLEAVVFWLLASQVRAQGARLRPIILVFALGYLALAINSYSFFFIAPVINELLIVLCLVLAIVTARVPGPENS
ncbi:MAG TPA: hypothetical protein VJN89_14295 [Candidatus Acidoferrum sp.]|nr:hypothetical protein [Candidatus Acidoferrum sp.]